MHNKQLESPSSEELKAGLLAERKYLPKGLLQNEQSLSKYRALQKETFYYRTHCETQIFAERDIISMLSIPPAKPVQFVNIYNDYLPYSFQLLMPMLEELNINFSQQEVQFSRLAT